MSRAKPDAPWYDGNRVTTYVGSSFAEGLSNDIDYWVSKKIELPNSDTDKVITVICERDSATHKAVLALETALYSLNMLSKGIDKALNITKEA